MQNPCTITVRASRRITPEKESKFSSRSIPERGREVAIYLSCQKRSISRPRLHPRVQRLRYIVHAQHVTPAKLLHLGLLQLFSSDWSLDREPVA